MSFTVGIGCRTRLIASFASLMSTHIRTWPSFLGTATMGETHGVASISGTFS